MRNALSIAFVPLFIACSTGPIQTAGGTADTGNARVEGRIVTANLDVVAGAKVNLYRSVLLPDSTRPAASAMTDASGRFVLDSIAPGTYQILALSSDSLLVASRSDIALDSGADTTLADLLAAPGAKVSGITDVVAPDSLRTLVWIAKTPLLQRVDSSGQFQISAIPAGTWEIVALVSAPSGLTMVVAGDTVYVSEGITLQNLTLSGFVPIAAGADSSDIDDFDDGDAFNALGGQWWSFSDRDEGANLVQTDTAFFGVQPDADSTGACAHLRLAFDTSAYSLGGIGTWLRTDWGLFKRAFDFTGVSSIACWARGFGGRVVMEAYSPIGDYVQLDTVTVGTTWTRFVVDIPAAMTRWTPENLACWEYGKRFVTGLQFTIWHGSTVADTVDLWIDDVKLYR